MSNFEDFPPQSVVRPTYEFHYPQRLVLQPSDTLGGDASINVDPNDTKQLKRNTNSHPCGMPGYKILDFTSQKRKRAKFDDAGRERVASCSGVWPCQSCLRNQASCHEREPKHGWMDCIPFSLKQVDIYALDFPSTQDKYDAIISGSDFIIVGDAERTFKPGIIWDLDAISSDCAEWICEEHVKPTANSRVWMLSSLKCEDLLSDFVNPNLSKALRVLVETSSILHNWGDNATYSHYSSSDLWSLRSFAGTQVLHSLEVILRNDRLAKASKDMLKAVFLVLLGITIAVGYTDSLGQSNNPVEPPPLTSEVFIEARQQLLRILAHHMILIAERVGLLNNDSTKSPLLQKAYRQWNEKAVFEWKVSSDPSSSSSSTCLSCALEQSGFSAPDLLYSTLEPKSTDQWACHGENNRDSEVQGVFQSQESSTNGSGAPNDSYRATSPYWAMTCRRAASPDPRQQGVYNADYVVFPEQGLELLDEDFFSNSVREAEPMNSQHRSLPNVYGETFSNADATFRGIGVTEPFVCASGAYDSNYQVPKCSPAGTQGMTQSTPYSDDTWSFRAAPNSAANSTASQPGPQYSTDAFDEAWLSMFGSDGSPYDGCSMVSQGDTAFDSSYPRRLDNDFVRTPTASEPLESSISSQKLGSLGWADPTFCTDSNAAIRCTDGNGAAPIRVFENVRCSLSAPPAPRKRRIRKGENPHKISQAATCLRCSSLRLSVGPQSIIFGRRLTAYSAGLMKPVRDALYLPYPELDPASLPSRYRGHTYGYRTVCADDIIAERNVPSHLKPRS